MFVVVFECRGLDEAVVQGDIFYIVRYVFVKFTLESFKLFKVLKFLGVLDFEITDYFESESLNFYKDFVTWVVVHLYSVVAILFYLRNSLTQLWLK